MTGFRALPILLGIAIFLASVPVLAQTVSISGQKFNDLNGNGAQGAGEPGLPGWTIQLDLGANGTVDATAVTDGAGNYSFTGLSAGTYRIREVGQAGWIQTTVNPVDFTVVSGSVTGVNFGNFQLASISGQTFNDLNGNGILDAGEPALAGVTIQLDKDANGTVDASTVTGGSGIYNFTGLTAGTYRVREVVPAGNTQTTVNPSDIVATSGTNVTGVNFGNLGAPTATSTPTSTSTATPTPTDTPTPTATPTPTSTATTTATASPTSTETPTSTATATAQPVGPQSPIPTLSGAGLAILGIALAGVALLFLTRQSGL